MNRTRDVNEPQIVVRVAPRLLGDVLALALRAEGLDVALYVDDDPPTAVVRGGRFDLAVVTEELPGDVIADTVLFLDPSGTSLSLSREEKERLLGDDRVGSLVSLIDELLGHQRLGA